MQRFNAFLLIHKGLRAMLYDTSISIQHTDFANAAEFPHSLEKLEVLLNVFDAHAGHEDKFIFCMLDVCDPQLQAEMEKEHMTDHALSAELRTLISKYKEATETADKSTIGSHIAYTYNEFISFNLSHLNKEEIVVNESLWKQYTDQDIMDANMRLVAAISPDEMKRSAIWMIRGCNNTELIGWFGLVKNSAPPQVIQMLLGIAEQELPAHRFEAIQNGVMEMV